MRSAALIFVATPAIAWSQAQAEIAHEHGTGRLDIAFSGAEVSLSLSVPAADIVGFERPAETDEDRALVAGAISDLSKPLELFVLPEGAMCFTTAANVTLSSERFGQNADTTQEHHSEFQADFQVECQDVGSIEVIRFTYFARFPKAEKLIVNVDRSGQSRTHDITRAAPELVF